MQKIIIYLLLFFSQQSFAQDIHRITGFLGLYHTSRGYTYSDTTGMDSIMLENQFRIGEMALDNEAVDNGFAFKEDIDSCISWKANRIFAIIEPPSERGTYNQPLDTSLYFPYDIKAAPGMIQGGRRFSLLSQLYGPPCGIILDDWNSDTSITHQVSDAVKGKYVDENGNVYGNSFAATPENKLFGVIYSTYVPAAALPYLDGLSYWYFNNQNCCYTNLDNDITQLRANAPHKEILIGIYIRNSFLRYTDPAGVHYMLQHAIDRYDDGDINGVILFAGAYLLKDSMTLNQWKGYALLSCLDSLYYPFLGEADGHIYDCNTGSSLPDAFVRLQCKGRISGDTLMRSRQKSDASGYYHAGLWAGNRNTDSTYYQAIAEKDGYDPETVSFWVKRNQSAVIPDISLCASGKGAKGDIVLFPNPVSSILNIKGKLILSGTLSIKDLAGRTILSQPFTNSLSAIDVTKLHDGFYLLELISNDGMTVTGKFVKW